MQQLISTDIVTCFMSLFVRPIMNQYTEAEPLFNLNLQGKDDAIQEVYGDTQEVGTGQKQRVRHDMECQVHQE